jgi:alpha-tubulin suppressor-like RCC1 family protein
VAGLAGRAVGGLQDGALWIWGRHESPEPRRVLPRATGAAAGSDASIALTQDGSLWQWRTGGQPAMVLHCPEANR